MHFVSSDLRAALGIVVSVLGCWQQSELLDNFLEELNPNSISISDKFLSSGESAYPIAWNSCNASKSQLNNLDCLTLDKVIKRGKHDKTTLYEALCYS